MKTTDSLVELFLNLVRIPSPSGHETEVAAYIQEYLKKHDISYKLDSTQNDSDTGNLIVRLPGNPKLSTLLFVAHMDTVETGEKSIVPQVRSGVITSDGTTVLGADDKAAVACLLEVLVEAGTKRERPTILAAFTTREEQGVMGSSLLDIPDDVDFAFNIDGAGNLGDFAYQSLGEVPFEIIVHGKAAHAAVEPEKGANALLAAGHILTALPIGKNEQGVVLNIGTVTGGTANNVVPDRAMLRGQLRAYSQVEIDEGLSKIEKTVADKATLYGCGYEFVTNPAAGAPPAFLTQDHPMTLIAKQAADHAEVPFRLVKMQGTSDANFLAAKYPTLSIFRGSTGPHSYDESITVETLHGLKRLLASVVVVVARQ